MCNDSTNDPLRVLADFALECEPGRIESLGGAGGFSGARFWRVACGERLLCLRRWPRKHPDRERLTFIHSVLRHVGDRGFQRVPVPIETRAACEERWQPATNETVRAVTYQGHFWELSPWLAGRANYHTAPSLTKLEAAMAALAEFHRAAADFDPPRCATAPSVARRLETLHAWTQEDIDRLSAELSFGTWPELTAVARQIIDRFQQGAERTEVRLRNIREAVVPIQPCLRDVWEPHVLYEGDRVTGLVDFGAMDRDTVATDVARLLGSLTREEELDWDTGLAAYEQLRPLSDVERQHVAAIARSTSLLAGMNWLRWIYLDGRVFEDRIAVIARIRAIL